MVSFVCICTYCKRVCKLPLNDFCVSTDMDSICTHIGTVVYVHSFVHLFIRYEIGHPENDDGV